MSYPHVNTSQQNKPLTMINRQAISEAATRIAPYIRKTPTININVNASVVNLKLEMLQVSGTFKARGAFNRLLLEKEKGSPAIVAASGGNHGVAVAYAAKVLGMTAHIFVPVICPQAKQDKLRSLGAQLHVGGSLFSEALAASTNFALEHHFPVSHAYDQFETLCGQGTLAREWFSQEPQLDTVLIAVGGGGLLGGMAAWIGDWTGETQGTWAQNTRIVAIEPNNCASLNNALKAGSRVVTPVSGIAADSLGATQVGELMFPIAQQLVASSVLVTDQAIVDAQHWLWNECRLRTEAGGVTSLAALLSGAYQALPDERVGVLLCGANVALH
jgi:threonine dehydratase